MGNLSKVFDNYIRITYNLKNVLACLNETTVNSGRLRSELQNFFLIQV